MSFVERLRKLSLTDRFVGPIARDQNQCGPDAQTERCGRVRDGVAQLVLSSIDHLKQVMPGSRGSAHRASIDVKFSQICQRITLVQFSKKRFLVKPFGQKPFDLERINGL